MNWHGNQGEPINRLGCRGDVVAPSHGPHGRAIIGAVGKPWIGHRGG